jgi:hypothetical protein
VEAALRQAVPSLRKQLYDLGRRHGLDVPVPIGVGQRVLMPSSKGIVIDSPRSLAVLNQSIGGRSRLFVEVDLQEPISLQLDTSPDDNRFGLHIDRLNEGAVCQGLQQRLQNGRYVHSFCIFS